MNYFDDGARVSVHGDPTNLVRAVGDNNYKTFTKEKDLVTQHRGERTADAGGCYFRERYRHRRTQC